MVEDGVVPRAGDGSTEVWARPWCDRVREAGDASGGWVEQAGSWPGGGEPALRREGGWPSLGVRSRILSVSEVALWPWPGPASWPGPGPSPGQLSPYIYPPAPTDDSSGLTELTSGRTSPSSPFSASIRE